MEQLNEQSKSLVLYVRSYVIERIGGMSVEQQEKLIKPIIDIIPSVSSLFSMQCPVISVYMDQLLANNAENANIIIQAIPLLSPLCEGVERCAWACISDAIKKNNIREAKAIMSVLPLLAPLNTFDQYWIWREMNSKLTRDKIDKLIQEIENETIDDPSDFTEDINEDNVIYIAQIFARLGKIKWKLADTIRLLLQLKIECMPPTIELIRARRSPYNGRLDYDNDNIRVTEYNEYNLKVLNKVLPNKLVLVKLNDDLLLAKTCIDDCYVLCNFARWTEDTKTIQDGILVNKDTIKCCYEINSAIQDELQKFVKLTINQLEQN